jgi:hypothetical protein
VQQFVLLQGLVGFQLHVAQSASFVLQVFQTNVPGSLGFRGKKLVADVTLYVKQLFVKLNAPGRWQTFVAQIARIVFRFLFLLAFFLLVFPLVVVVVVADPPSVRSSAARSGG